MADYIVESNVPAKVVALSQERADALDRLMELGSLMLVADVAAHAAASQVQQQIATAEKELEAQRVALKAPALAVCNAIDEAARPYLKGLNAARKGLEQRIAAFQIEENARRAGEARRLAEEAAAKERELEAQRAADACPLDDPIEAKPIRVEPPPAPPMLRSGVVARLVPKLIIDDASLIPREFAGFVLLKPDEAVITSLCKLGKVPPGCRWEKVTQTASKAGG
jgi:hypothetical protein